jgi:energy-converting hydrogenase Eha subunit F
LLKKRNATSGIIVNAGILVNIANPKNMPESKTRIFLLLLLVVLLLLLLASLAYNANNIEDKRKGRRIESSNILLKSQVIGITANNTDAINATFLFLL